MRPKQPIASPAAIRGSHSSFCSSLPQRQIAYIASDPVPKRASAAAVARLELRAGQAVGGGARAGAAVAVQMHSQHAELAELGREPLSETLPARTTPPPSGAPVATNALIVSRMSRSSSESTLSMPRKSLGLIAAGAAAVVAMLLHSSPDFFESPIDRVPCGMPPRCRSHRGSATASPAAGSPWAAATRTCGGSRGTRSARRTASCASRSATKRCRPSPGSPSQTDTLPARLGRLAARSRRSSRTRARECGRGTRIRPAAGRPADGSRSTSTTEPTQEVVIAHELAGRAIKGQPVVELDAARRFPDRPGARSQREACRVRSAPAPRRHHQRAGRAT